MIHTITGTTTVVGVLGYPVAHSLSPLMHNAAFREEGLDWVYVPFPVPPASLAASLAGVVALGVRGVNVTIPHKQAVIPQLARLTREAEAIGSVNTILVTADGLLGHSTDGPGFLRALMERGFDPQGARVVLLGAGGAARAIVGALAGAEVEEITVVARHPERVAAFTCLPPHVAMRTLSWGDAAVGEVLARADLLVNATSVGMAPNDTDSSPVPAGWLHERLWVYDLVYTPRHTALLRDAAARGCAIIDGVAMLVYQGAEAFTLWTHRQAPIAVMESAVAAHLQQTETVNLSVRE